VKWFKGHTPIEPSEKYKIKRDKHSAELKILKLKPDDAGVYKCKAGIAETEATLTVEGMSREGGLAWFYGLIFHLRFLFLRLISTVFPC